MTRNTVVCNQDNGGVLPTPVPGFGVIGWVEEINGQGAEEVSEFIPTRHELEQLAEYWYTQYLEIERWEDMTQSTGSTELRLKGFATQRVNRIELLIGQEAVDRAYQSAKRSLDSPNESVQQAVSR
tara:strand:- start:85 stop:462 length:378 start_codon:yes stop_codon:yes gene_type:complete